MFANASKRVKGEEKRETDWAGWIRGLLLTWYWFTNADLQLYEVKHKNMICKALGLFGGLNKMDKKFN